MKRMLPFLLMLVFAFVANAQTNEVAVQVSSGLFNYGGKSATSSSVLFVSDLAPHYNVNNIYGTKSEFSYGINVQAQRVTKRNFIWGIGVGYDQLAASARIDNLLNMGGSYNITNGKAKLTTHSIRTNPYFGYRIPVKAVKLDLTAGFNVSFITKSTGHVTYDDQNDVFAKKSDANLNIKADFGPMAGVAVSYKRIAVSGSYNYGLINYQRMMDGANPEVYSRYLRLGLAYRIL